MRIISDMRHFSSRSRPRWSSWSLALLALAGLCAGRGPARADTPWSEFRGPTGDGDAKKAYGTGTVIRALGRERIVIPSAGATIAYDPSTGEELWRVNHGGMNASARPLFGNGLVYLNTAAGGMKTLAVRPEGSGDITGTAVAWTSPQGSGSRSSQLLLGERMFHVGDAGTATVLDALTGKAVWQKRLGGGILVVASRRGGEDLLPEPGGTDVRGDGGRAVRGDRREHARRGLHGIPGGVRRRALPADEGHLYKIVKSE